MRRARLAFTGAAGGLALLALTWWARAYLDLGRHADRSVLRGFADLHRPGLDRLTRFVAGLCNPNPYVFLAAIAVLLALLRRRPRVAVTIGVIVFGANASTQMLKPLLSTARLIPLYQGVDPIAAASWPSGHATAAMALALVSVIAAPARWRPRVAAAMVGFSVAVCYSFLELGWHYPSDVLGGFLVAATWTLLGVAALDLIDDRWPRRAGWSVSGRAVPLSLGQVLMPVAALILGGLGFAGLLALARPHAVVSYARAHEAFMVGAAAIGALSLLLVTGTTLVLRR